MERKSLIAERVLRGKQTFKRSLHTSATRQDEQRKPLDSTSSIPEPPSEAAAQPSPENHPLPNLPSQTAQHRWHSAQRLSHLMDTLLARASLASQRINTYTGTDYTGIEALRQQITSQESTVKDRHAAVEAARTSHREAHAKQSGAQKEIVSLLERKSSWSPADLERYMGLVRSEHSLESDVGTAKDGLQAAERELEESRSLLERLERKQYHEEQIWSDTIRRNSTWVTFGLMGVNIVLLLAQIAIFEPYRRRKIVREVKVALDEKAAGAGVLAPVREVERQVDEVVEPAAGKDVEAIEMAVADDRARLSENAAPKQDEAGRTALAAGEVLPEEARKVEGGAPVPAQPAMPRQPPETWTGSWEAALEGLQDLFSERIVQIKKVDLTTVALQGAATGVAAMGILFVMFRPR